jgi:hypothetical protein
MFVVSLPCSCSCSFSCSCSCSCSCFYSYLDLLGKGKTAAECLAELNSNIIKYGNSDKQAGHRGNALGPLLPRLRASATVTLAKQEAAASIRSLRSTRLVPITHSNEARKIIIE